MSKYLRYAYTKHEPMSVVVINRTKTIVDNFVTERENYLLLRVDIN